MRKLIIFIMAAISLTACKKESAFKETCWKCIENGLRTDYCADSPEGVTSSENQMKQEHPNWQTICTKQ